MKKFFAVLTVVASMAAMMIGCGDSKSSSGSGSGGGGGGTGDCAAKGSAACISCQETKCSDAYNASESSCGDYYTCACACAASDTACQQGCQSKADATCAQDLSTLAGCLLQNCLSDCTTAAP